MLNGNALSLNFACFLLKQKGVWSSHQSFSLCKSKVWWILESFKLRKVRWTYRENGDTDTSNIGTHYAHMTHQKDFCRSHEFKVGKSMLLMSSLIRYRTLDFFFLFLAFFWPHIELVLVAEFKVLLINFIAFIY